MDHQVGLFVLGAAAFVVACGGTSRSGGATQGPSTDTSSTTGSGNATASDTGASSSGAFGGAASSSASGSTTGGGSSSVAGGSGGAGGTDPGASGAGGEGAATSTTEGTSGGPSQLYGYWLALAAVGDCADVMEYLAFFTDSQMQEIFDDEDKCMPPDTWTTTYDDGTYTLDGHTLTYELDSGRRTRFNFAVGTLGTSEVLFHSIFLPEGDAVWRSDTSVETEATDGSVEYRNDVGVTITFDRAIPNTGEGTCTATIDFSVNQFDIDSTDGQTEHVYSGSVDDVPCSYAESVRGQQITFEGLSFDAHPNWVAANVVAFFAAGDLWISPGGEFLFANSYLKEDGIPERLQ